jgi:hypothetical protein
MALKLPSATSLDDAAYVSSWYWPLAPLSGGYNCLNDRRAGLRNVAMGCRANKAASPNQRDSISPGDDQE